MGEQDQEVGLGWQNWKAGMVCEPLSVYITAKVASVDKQRQPHVIKLKVRFSSFNNLLSFIFYLLQ